MANDIQSMLGNPLLNIGLGILSQSGPSPYPQGLSGIGRGAMLGMQNLQKNQQAQLLNQYRRAQLEQVQRQQEQSEATKQAYGKFFQDHPMGGLLGADTGLARSVAQSMLSPQQPGKPQTVSPGSALVSPTGEVIHQQPDRPREPKDRRIVQDPNGVNRYADTGEPVFPNVTPESKDKGFGSSMYGLALTQLEEATKEKESAGMLSPETMRKVESAASILERPMVRQGPDGALYEVPPIGVPGAYKGLLQDPAGAPTADSGGPRKLLESGETLDKRRRVESAVSDIADIANMINAAEKEGDVITGVAGAAKRGTYPLARGMLEMFGIDAPEALRPKSEILKGRLEALKFQLAPLIIEQKGRELSNADIERMDNIFGGAFADKEQLRSELDWMLNKLESIYGAYQ